MANHTIDKFKYGSDTFVLQDNVSGYTTNTGTVTSVGISNDTNGGLSVNGSPITGSGSITLGHSNVLSSAQTTSAVYPIKIDKNGHISEYGSAVNIPSLSYSGTNGQNYIVLADDLDNDDPAIENTTMTASGSYPYSEVSSYIKPTEAAFNSYYAENSSTSHTGYIGIYPPEGSVSISGDGGVTITDVVTPTADEDAANKKYVDDSIPSITLNGSSTTSPSFYAPTSAGTNGYYLKSNGSGAPTWAAISAGGVTDVTVGGTSVVTSGVAVIASPVQIVRW